MFIRCSLYGYSVKNVDILLKLNLNILLDNFTEIHYVWQEICNVRMIDVDLVHFRNSSKYHCL